MLSRLLFLSLLFALFQNVAFAESYTIGINDDPDNELRRLDLLPGDEIIIANGTYTDQGLKFIGIGTEEAPIILRAESPGGVILNGRSYVQFDGRYLQAEGLIWYNGDDYLRTTNSLAVEFRGSVNRHAHFCRLTNCAIIDYNYKFLDDSDSDKDGDTTELLWAHSKTWISIFGTHNRVDHCYFYHKRTEGSLIVTELRQDDQWLDEDPSRNDQTPQYETVQHRIDHNYFGDIQLGRPDRADNNEAIRVGTSTYSSFNAEITVENNYFYDCSAEIETISNKSQNNIYRNNVLFHCLGGIVMRHGDGALITNNVILGDGLTNNAGIRLNGENHTVVGNYISGVTGTGMRAAFTMRNAGSVTGDDIGGGYEQARFNTIAYNTIVDCTEPMNIGSSGSSNNNYTPVSNTIVNNLIYAPNANKGIVTTLNTSQFDQAITTWGGNYLYAKALGTSPIDGVTFADPLTETRPDGFVTLTSSSPARQAAIDGYNDLTTDLDGETIPATQSDIGADQISALRSVQAQLDLSQVGPDWNASILPAALKLSVPISQIRSIDIPVQFPVLLSDYALWQSPNLQNWYPYPASLNTLTENTLTLRLRPDATGFFCIQK